MEVFCPLFSPPTPCVAALMAPVYCILNARALQVEVQEVLYGNSSSQTVHQKQTADMHDRCIGFIPAVQCGAAVLLSRSFVLRLFSFEAKGLFSLYFFMTFKKQCFFDNLYTNWRIYFGNKPTPFFMKPLDYKCKCMPCFPLVAAEIFHQGVVRCSYLH